MGWIKRMQRRRFGAGVVTSVKEKKNHEWFKRFDVVYYYYYCYKKFYYYNCYCYYYCYCCYYYYYYFYYSNRQGNIVSLPVAWCTRVPAPESRLPGPGRRLATPRVSRRTPPTAAGIPAGQERSGQVRGGQRSRGQYWGTFEEVLEEVGVYDCYSNL